MKEAIMTKRVLFIQNSSINESFVINDIATYLKQQGYVVDLLIKNEEMFFYQKIAKFNPQLVIMPCPILDNKIFFDIAKKIKERISSQILFWGSAATFYPKFVLKNKYCDFVCRGEGELAIVELLAKINNKKLYKTIKNIGYKYKNKLYLNKLRPLVEDLDMFPLPDRSIYYKYASLRNLNSKRFITSRGCLMLCNACWNNAISNVYRNPENFYRRKSPDRVIQEIAIVKQRYPLTTLHFSDDLFVHPDYHEWLVSFLGLYKKKINLQYTCNIRPDFINDSVVRILARSGCRAVAMSVESGCSKLRNDILGKNITDDQISSAAQLLHRYNIKVLTFNIISLPKESIDDAINTIEFNQKIKADYSRVNILFPIPYSSLFNKKCIDKKTRNAIMDISNLKINLSITKTFFSKRREREFQKLYFLFLALIKFNISKEMIKVLISLPLFNLYKIIWIIMTQVNERSFFKVNILCGLFYYIRTMGVKNKSENFTSIY